MAASLELQTPLALRAIIMHVKADEVAAGTVLIKKLWEIHVAGGVVDKHFLKTLKAIESLKSELLKLELAIAGGRTN